MIRSRHLARILAMQALYQFDVQQATADIAPRGVIEPLAAEMEAPEAAIRYACELVTGVWQQRSKYDEMISGVSEHWQVSRMAVVDRNILRIALHELLHSLDVPVRVVFDEAIEIGKEYGAAETPNFVNGVLDAVFKNHPACKIARGES